MTNRPFFSIVIPTFNSESYLRECLASLSDQTSQDYEVIVIDKQSTDSTLEIIRSFNLPQIRILSQCSSSLPEALDEGFHAANGILLCWLNSDDAYARPDALSIIKNRYLQLPRHNTFIYANHLSIDCDGVITSLCSSHWPTSRYERALGGFNLCTGSLFFSNDLFVAFGGFGNRYKISFEYLLIDYLFLHGSPTFVPVYVYAYRAHHNQLSSDRKSVV